MSDLADLESYLAVREVDEKTALDVIASVERDLDRMGCARTYAEHTLAPARLVVAHVEQMRTFVERARRDLVNPADLARAAEAARALMGTTGTRRAA